MCRIRCGDLHNVILAKEREFEANMGQIVSLKPAQAIEWNFILKKKWVNKKKNEEIDILTTPFIYNILYRWMEISHHAT